MSSTAGPTLDFAYSGTPERLTSVQASDGRSVSYGYDNGGRLTSVTGVDGKSTAITVDAEGRITSIADPSGVVVVANTYDVHGRVDTQSTATGVSTFAYDEWTGATTVTTTSGTAPPQVVVYRRFGSQRGVTVASRSQLGLPA